ncbi:MAG: Ppx/GppA family phosphatase [Verrucomicrobiales bacterium]|nr:Ppx/GppA family phosphatase [Verrucomicrobiales bacterium]
MRRAVLDVGTNSVKLLVADLAPPTVRPVLERSIQTRLGRGLATTGRLDPAAVAETVRVIARLHAEARQLGAERVRIAATSAAREASNTGDLLDAVRTATGLVVEVLSGEQEARWGFAGVTTDPDLQDRSILLLDVGGGSTELALGRVGNLRFHASYPLGAVRWLERLHPSDPPRPSELERGRRELAETVGSLVVPPLQPHLVGVRQGPLQLVGTGGTASVLAAMALELVAFDRAAIDGRVLRAAEVTARLEQLWSLPLARRRVLPGLPPERADVMLTGTLIYEGLMAVLGFESLRITTRGLRYAALCDVA